MFNIIKYPHSCKNEHIIIFAENLYIVHLNLKDLEDYFFGGWIRTYTCHSEALHMTW